MRRALFLNHNRRGRGTWSRLFHLARELARRDWECELWTASPRRRLCARTETAEGVRIIETPWLLSAWLAGNGLDPWDLLWRAWHALRKTRCKKFPIDLLFISDHLPSVSLPAFLFLRRRPAKANCLAIADWADLFTSGGLREKYNGLPTRTLYRLEAWLERAIKKSADGCTAISPLLAELLQKKIGMAPARILFLPNGCDASHAWEPDVAEAKRRLNLDANTLRIGVLASRGVLSLEEVTALTAFLARAQHVCDRPIVAALLGPFSRETQQRLARICRVDAIGWQEGDALRAHIAACDVGWVWDPPTRYHASRHPTRLAAWLEAGRPVVISPVGFYAESLVAAGAGIYCTNPSAPTPDEAQALDALCVDQNVRASMGRAARMWTEGEGGWQRVGERFHAWLTILSS